MTKFDELITVASWEERFLLSSQQILKNNEIKKITMFYFEEYESLSKRNRLSLNDLSKNLKINIESEQLSFSDIIGTWRKLTSRFFSEDYNQMNVLIDLSTMPREIIFYILSYLKTSKSNISYCYSQPEAYNGDWLGRDPGKPRLLYQLSGIYQFGMPTTFIIITGFDVERTEHLIKKFEPSKVLLGIQEGDQFENLKNNQLRHMELQLGAVDIETFSLDVFSKDHGVKAINRQIKKAKKDSNILISSLGPKLSAIGIFKSHQNYPEIGIVYAPLNEYNPDYSNGIGESFSGKI